MIINFKTEKTILAPPAHVTTVKAYRRYLYDLVTPTQATISDTEWYARRLKFVRAINAIRAHKNVRITVNGVRKSKSTQILRKFIVWLLDSKRLNVRYRDLPAGTPNPSPENDSCELTLEPRTSPKSRKPKHEKTGVQNKPLTPAKRAGKKENPFSEYDSAFLDKARKVWFKHRRNGVKLADVVHNYDDFCK